MNTSKRITPAAEQAILAGVKMTMRLHDLNIRPEEEDVSLVELAYHLVDPMRPRRGQLDNLNKVVIAERAGTTLGNEVSP